MSGFFFFTAVPPGQKKAGPEETQIAYLRASS